MHPNKKIWLLFLPLFYILFTSFTQDIRFRKIDMSSGLSFNSVLCIIEDHDGLIWIGTREGLNKYNSVDNIIYKNKFGDSLSLSNNQINCIYESLTNDLWVGTANGLNRYNRNRNDFSQFLVAPDSTGISNGYVKCIVQNTDSNIWVGTSYGLNIFKQNCNCFQHIQIEEPPSLCNNIIALFRDAQNRIWLGTKGGLFVWENNKFKKIEFQSELKDIPNSNEIRDIKQDKTGLMWIATEEDGIYSFDFSEDRIRNVNHLYKGNSIMISDHIRKILIDNDSLWLATLDGLCIVEKNTNKITNIVYSRKIRRE